MFKILDLSKFPTKIGPIGHIFLQIPLLFSRSEFLSGFLRKGFTQKPLLVNKKWDL